MWTPDGRSLYFASSRGGTFNLWKIAAAGGAPQQITAGQGDDAELSLSADGQRVAFATFHAHTRIAALPIPALPGTSLHVLTTDPARGQNFPEYSPDGKRLTYFSWVKGAEPEQIWISNADGSDATPLVVNQNHNVFPRWSQNGSHIFFLSWAFQNAPDAEHHDETDEVPSTGGDPRMILPGPAASGGCAGPNGSIIYRGAHAVESLQPASGKIQTLGPMPQPLPSTDLACAADGSAIAYGVHARYDGDPQQGVWVYDFHHPARQVFHGWVAGYNLATGPHGSIGFLAGSTNLQSSLETVNWNGSGLTNLHVTVPVPYDYYWTGRSFISISPSGRSVAFDYDDALQANLGLITFRK
ncbi:MAG: hypothetical protein ACRD0Y_14530 [Terriglobales bacterium]